MRDDLSIPGRRSRLREPGTLPSRRRKGAIFITALWITLILGALVLVFARSMRVELIAAANRSSITKVNAVELGAEQYVLAQVDDTNGDASFITSAPARAIQLGEGYFWIIRPDGDNVNLYDYGIEDEASKLNINTATSNDLMLLPNMTQDVADSIVNWRTANGGTTSSNNQGAQSSYYETLPNPYHAKGAPFDSVEELLLVENMTMDLMYGADRNHNGVIDLSEQAAGGNLPTFGGVTSPIRGIAPYLTCFSVEPNTDSTGAARVNVNGTAAPANTVTTGASAAKPPGNSSSNKSGGNTANADPATALRNALTSANVPAGDVTNIMNRYQGAQKPFRSIFDFAQKTGMSQQDLALCIDKLTTNTAQTTQGLVNVNTAPEAVLMCLPGLEQSDADAIITARSSADTSNMAWLMGALTPQKLEGIASRVTGRSFIYSADIVAVSRDGRAFKRVKIVVDGQNSPPRIIFRRDLTSLGWPLDPTIRQQLRSGQPIQTGNGAPGDVQGGTAGQVQM